MALSATTRPKEQRQIDSPDGRQQQLSRGAAAAVMGAADAARWSHVQAYDTFSEDPACASSRPDIPSLPHAQGRLRLLDNMFMPE